MAKSQLDIAKEVSYGLLGQVISLQAELEQVKEELAQLKAEQLKNKESKEDASKPIV